MLPKEGTAARAGLDALELAERHSRLSVLPFVGIMAPPHHTTQDRDAEI